MSRPEAAESRGPAEQLERWEWGVAVREGPQGTDTWEDTLEREKQGRQGGATLQFLPWEGKQEMGENVAQTLGTCKTKQHHPPLLPESLPLSYHLQQPETPPRAKDNTRPASSQHQSARLLRRSQETGPSQGLSQNKVLAQTRNSRDSIPAP